MRRVVLLAALSLLPASPFVGPAVAQQAVVQPATARGVATYTEAIRRSREVVADRMDETAIPGLSVAVWADGEVRWAEGFGFADLEQRVPVDADTKFRIASISKALAAAGLGVLIQEGRLDLDAPVQTYVPSFPEKAWPLTTRQIASHTGGVRHYDGDEFASSVKYGDVVEALEIFADSPLQFEPGTEYSYSTYGWNLVSAVMQGAAGQPFLQFMRERVLDPLDLDETIAEFTDSIIPGRARFYQNVDGRVINAPYVDNSNKWAGGGYLSTARDMARYGASYLSNDILDPATVELLWTPVVPSEEDSRYGLGWNRADVDGIGTAWHTGGAMGGTTVLIVQPERGIAVAILTNVQGAGQTETAHAIADLFAGAM
jgi:CubicO group peptidase (beta-lactamase class C family)